MIKAQKKVLPSGLRLVTIPHRDSVAVTVLVLVEAGSKYETKNWNGLSHFLEHMCFKGTTKRPTSFAITSELDSLGARYNAFTSQEYTGYFATVAPKHLERALEVIADMYLDPIFPEAEIEKEKGVIVEEINMYQDMPQRYVQELFLNLLYGDQPAGWDIAGTKETVRSFTRQDFVDYRSHHYVAKATTVVVAGAFDEKQVARLIRSRFAVISTAHKHLKLPIKERQTAPAVRLQFKKSDQCHLVLGVRALDLFNPQEPVAQVLAAILGGGMSSRLFRRVREELGAAYYVRAGHEAFTDHGVFQVAAGVDLKRVEVVIAAILDELKKLTKELVSVTELQRTKDSLMGNLLIGLETSSDLALFHGIEETLKHKLTSPKQIIRVINRVTAKQINTLAKKLFINQHLNLALIGPYEAADRFEKLLHL